VHAVAALAVTMSLAWLSFLSAVVLVLLILHQGPRLAALELAGAAVLLAVLNLLLRAPLGVMFGSALSVWAPAGALALLMLRTRSLTLTLQVAWLVTIAGLLLFFAAVSDPAAFWHDRIEALREAFIAQGLHEQAAMFRQDDAVVAEQMTMFVAVLVWSVSVVGLVLGYKLERQLPGREARFGRFRDVNFGRVIAFATAGASIVAWLSGWMVVQSAAFVMFAMFWMQGLAIAHWSHGQGFLPTFGLAAVYVLMPLLNVILLMGLAVTGYVDAWFGFRRRRAAK
jgi:hypothetical protein